MTPTPQPGRPAGYSPPRPSPAIGLTAAGLMKLRSWMSLLGIDHERYDRPGLISLIGLAETLSNADYTPGSFPTGRLAKAILALVRG